MRLGVLCGVGQDWKESIKRVQVAESLGYEMVATGEAWGTSTIPWMTLLATHTEKISIGTAILNVFSRSPAAIAQEFAMLEVLSGGRMICGLGSSGHRVIEHFHGVPFKKPLKRIREYTDIFNRLIAGERLEYSGELFELSRGFTLDYKRPRDHVPVYIAAITPKSIAQTGAIADGIYPIHWPKDRFASLRDELNQGARNASRPDAAVTIAPFTNVYVLDGEKDEDVWMAARAPLFQYINRMGDFYWKMLASEGFDSEVQVSRDAWKKRDREGAMMAITERMVRSIQVVGTPESITEQLKERSSLGADLQLVPMPFGSISDVGRQLEQYLG